MKISVFRRSRTSPVGYEWHNHGGHRWLKVWVGSPTHHRWWATTIYFYL